MRKHRASKHREYVGNSTRLIEKLPIDGYVVKPEHLQRLHSIITDCELFQGDSSTDRNCIVTYRAFLEDGSVFQFRSIEEVLSHPNTPPEVIEGLRISALGEGDEKIEVELDNSGEVVIDACGPPHVVEGVVHTIGQHLRALDQQFSWFVKSFVLNSRPRRLAARLAVQATLMLVFLLGYYFYALKVGVDVSSDLISPGMTYYQSVEAAIRSQDLTEKLNVLLLGNFRGFMNVTDVLRLLRNLMVACVLAVLILGTAAWISRHLKHYFPPSFFAIGHQKEMLVRIEKKRELWIAGIIVGFIVNIIAGILVAVLGG